MHYWSSARTRRSALQASADTGLLLIALLCLPLSAALAQAQTGQQSDDAYDALVQKGIGEYERGNWLEAKVFFERAHALQPSARTLRSLGMTAYELRSYVEASGYLEAALASRDRPLTDSMRVQVENVLREAKAFSARLQVALEPNDARLRVDGQEPTRDNTGRLLLDAGEHELSASAPGFQSTSQRWTARPGANAELVLHLRRIAAGTTPLARAPEAALTRTSALGTQQKIGLALGAAGVLSLGAAATFTGLMLSKNASSNDGHCNGLGCDPRGMELRDSARTFGDVASVTAVAGAVLLGAGVVTYLMGGSQERAPVRVGVAASGAIVLAGAL
jgi:tetratricopeptide (TPR) repeat protein